MTQIRAKVSHVRGRVKHHLRNTFVPHQGNNYHPHAIRRRALHVYGLVLIGAKVATIAFVSFYAGQARLTTVTSDAIIALTNKARQERHVAVLAPNALLQKAAQSKAQDMIKQQYFAHISPGKVTPWEWFRRAGYTYSYAGENLAIDFMASEDIIKAWLNSPSHRSNLLSTRYKDIGVATATGSINGSESLIVVQMFGTPVKPVTTKKTTKPVQTPAPEPTKTALAKKPKVVLGETDKPVAPATPTIESPGDKSMVRVSQPTFVGQAESKSTLEVKLNGRIMAQEVVPDNGVFSIKSTAEFGEGPQTVSVTASARGLTSPAVSRTFSIDTIPPDLVRAASYAIPSLVGPDTYDLWVTASPEVVSASCACGGRTVSLTKVGDRFVGRVTMTTRGATAGAITISLTDGAGNVVRVPLLEADMLTTGVAAAPDGPGTKALRIIFYSRYFMTIVLLLIFTVTALNVSLNWRRRQHPALLGLLLLMYVSGAMIIL